jgi:hypothetical protein
MDPDTAAAYVWYLEECRLVDVCIPAGTPRPTAHAALDALAGFAKRHELRLHDRDRDHDIYLDHPRRLTP